MLTTLTSYEASYDYLFPFFYLLYFNFIGKICCTYPPLPTFYFHLAAVKTAVLCSSKTQYP